LATGCRFFERTFNRRMALWAGEQSLAMSSLFQQS